jgi:glycosyltransferase involved in cell wall biosynthesis
MRICLLSREYPPETGWGGIGAYSQQLARALADGGHDVHVICLTKRDSVAPAVSYFDGLVAVHRVPWAEPLEKWVLVLATLSNSHHLLKAAVAMWNKFLPLHKEKAFDIVEAPDHLAEGLFVALTGIAPLVVRLHTPHFKLVADGYHNLTRDLDNDVVANLERLAILEADVASSPSLDLAAFVATSSGMALDSIEIVRNPVDTQKFCPEGERAHPPGVRLDDEQAAIVFFAGRLEARKGIQYLIDAVPHVVKKFPKTQFVVLGADTLTGANASSVREALVKQLQQNGLSASVVFLDHAPLAEMPNYYRMADLCVVPSLYDNAPYTVLEALACGKPVVASTAGGTPEYIKVNITGLTVPKQDSAALAEAINTLLQDRQKLKAFGAAARETAVNEYALNIIADQAVKTYELAAKRHKERLGRRIYRKAPELLLDDLNELLGSYHNRLHKFGEDLSIRYRSRKWINMLKTRPRLLLGYAGLTIGKLIARCLRPTPAGLQQKLKRLETQLDLKMQTSEKP